MIQGQVQPVYFCKISHLDGKLQAIGAAYYASRSYTINAQIRVLAILLSLSRVDAALLCMHYLRYYQSLLTSMAFWSLIHAGIPAVYYHGC